MTWCANVRAEPARTTPPRATGKARRTTTSQRRGTAGKGSAAGGHGTPTGACRGLATRGRGRAEKNTVCTKAGARWGTALRSGAAAPGQAQRVYCILPEAEEGVGVSFSGLDTCWPKARLYPAVSAKPQAAVWPLFCFPVLGRLYRSSMPLPTLRTQVQLSTGAAHT